MQSQILTKIFLLSTFILSCNTPVLSSPRESAAAEQLHSENKEAELPTIDAMTVSTRAVNLQQLLDLEGIIPELSRYQVVFIGEHHPRYDHHLNQLALIQGLYERYPELVLGVEFFQQPFQPYLEQYIAGELSTREFLDKTEYYDRWRYDFRLYAPIFEFAREKGIPMLALNVPTELIQKVGREGLEGLSKEERAQLPAQIDRSSAEYRQRLQKVYENHPQHFGDFETFYEAQLVWDETMAESATRYLKDYPGSHMVVLAGNGHLAYGVGIPERLSRRLEDASVAIVLNDWKGILEPELANYLLLSEKKELPKAGFLGVLLEPAEGKLKISEFSENSAAKATGIKEGDELLSLDGYPVSDMADVKEVMWDKQPGEEIRVKVHRSGLLRKNKGLEFQVKLR